MPDAVGLEVEASFSPLLKERSGLRKVPYTVIWISQEGGCGCASQSPPEVLASSLSIPSLYVFLLAPGRGQASSMQSRACSVTQTFSIASLRGA